MGRRILAGCLLFIILLSEARASGEPVEIDAVETAVATAQEQTAQELALTSGAYVLMDTDSGAILCEKDATKELAMASITKIMTILLVMEALDAGTITYDTMVSVSEHAASMGGSQVYLEVGEQLSVDDMLKCICIASANDASVAMAEHLGGTEEAFVEKMNQRAKELGMNNTCFVNCYGLDTDGHYSCAKDVAIMSRELMKNHPEISRYTTTWMDSIVHNTARGSSEFGLSNTNKLIKSYEGITGLKTGSTGNALYCLSATATRNGCNLVAVIMAAPNTKTRFAEAAKLLNYGFANYYRYEDTTSATEKYAVPIIGAMENSMCGIVEEPFGILLPQGTGESQIKKEIVFEKVSAPVEQGTVIGTIVYRMGEVELGNVPIVAEESVGRAKYSDYLGKLMEMFF